MPYAFAAAVLALAMVSAKVMQVPFSTISRDPASLAGVHPFTGALSNLGVLLWCGTAASCFFAWGLTRGGVEPQYRQFLFAAGLLSSILLLDDLFMLHEGVLPSFGMSEFVAYGLYAAAMLAFLGGFGKVILETDYILLVSALLFFGLSILADSVSFLGTRVEDSAKFVGIVSWCFYHVKSAHQLLLLQLAGKKESISAAGLSSPVPRWRE